MSILAYYTRYAIEQSLRARGIGRSWQRIKHILQSHQAVTIVMPEMDNKHVHTVRVSTEPDAAQKEIYDRLCIEKVEIKRKSITIKSRNCSVENKKANISNML